MCSEKYREEKSKTEDQVVETEWEKIKAHKNANVENNIFPPLFQTNTRLCYEDPRN